MANGCSAPRFAQVVDWALRKACEVARKACDQHDAAYYRGGTLDEKLAADIVLFENVKVAMMASNETYPDALGVACAIFRGLQTPIALAHWYTPPAVERGPQEA